MVKTKSAVDVVEDERDPDVIPSQFSKCFFNILCPVYEVLCTATALSKLK